MSTAVIEIPNELIQVLGAELQSHTKGFACQAREVQDNFRRVGQPMESFEFGDLWKGKDFAWRALLNPSFQVEIMLAIGNRRDQVVAEEQLNLVCPILEALSESMPDDAMIDLMTEGDGAAEVLSDKLFAYFAKVKATSRMTVGG